MCSRAGALRVGALRVGALGLAVLVAGCGEKTPTVGVGEAPPVGFPAPSPRVSGGDTTVADTTYADTLGTSADTVRADSSASAVEAPPAPPFDAFWGTFRAAVRAGRRAEVSAIAVVGPGGIVPGEWPGASEALLTEPFRPVVLALAPRDVSYDGGDRVANAVVGFDAEGRVVPEDEAATDSGLFLRFRVVDGAWRLVEAALAG